VENLQRENENHNHKLEACRFRGRRFGAAMDGGKEGCWGDPKIGVEDQPVGNSCQAHDLPQQPLAVSTNQTRGEQQSQYDVQLVHVPPPERFAGSV
jgi:hypothetical protein